MDELSLTHCKYECKYHIVFAPKFRRQIIYGKIKKEIGKILRKLCEYKGERVGIREARKHATWYTKGLRGAAEYRAKMSSIESFDDLKFIAGEFIELSQTTDH